MKKALIIANMLVAYVNVYGMDQKSVQAKEFSTSCQLDVKVLVSSMKDKLYAIFKTAQSLLKNNKIFSEDARLLYSKLNFEDIWEEIERIFFSDFSLENARQTSSDIEDIFLRLEKIFEKNSVEEQTYGNTFESAAKIGAKLFYKQVLGNSKLGKDLYEVAVQEIDSAECVQGLDSKSFSDSQTSFDNGIKCTYYDYNDLLLTLIHETGHLLDWFYRIRETLEQPKALEVFDKRSKFFYEIARSVHDQQSEYVSVFFEFLLRSSHFRENLYLKDSSAHRFRLVGIYDDFIRKSLGSELMIAYEKEQLGKVVNEKDQLKKVVDEKEQDAFVQKLGKYKIFQQYLEILLEPQEIFPTTTDFDDAIRKKKPLWDNLLYTLDLKGYQDLSSYFRDIDKGKRKILSSSSLHDIKSFKFSKNLLEAEVSQREDSLEVEVSLPELEGIDWKEIEDIVWNKRHRFDLIIMGLMVNSIKNINSDQKIANFKKLNNHTEGSYNAFRLIKEKGYFDILKSGKSLPIEEVMKELTKPAGTLNLTEKSAEEFLEFLKS